MDFDKTVVTTLKGGVVSAHPAAKSGGASYTSNLFDNCWQEVTNPEICALLRQCTDYSRKGQHAQAIELLGKINAVHKITVKWVATEPTWYSAAPSGTQPLKMATTGTSTSTGIPKVVGEGFTSNEGKTTPPVTPETESNGLTSGQNLQLKISIIERLVKFFSEWNWKTVKSTRFLKTLKYYCNKSTSAGIRYIGDYLKLTGHPDVDEIIPKLKSDEFKRIIDDVIKSNIEPECNHRIEIYYGDPGIGKTTKVLARYPGIVMFPCHEQVLPVDVMKTFAFNDENGNPQFKKSDVRIAMEDGKPIGFEEAGLLPMGTLRFIQNITDNKPYVDFEGERVFIKDGFKIIFTMNLEVNGIIYPLPEPIVDRAATIEEFTITPAELAARL